LNPALRGWPGLKATLSAGFHCRSCRFMPRCGSPVPGGCVEPDRALTSMAPSVNYTAPGEFQELGKNRWSSDDIVRLLAQSCDNAGNAHVSLSRYMRQRYTTAAGRRPPRPPAIIMPVSSPPVSEQGTFCGLNSAVESREGAFRLVIFVGGGGPGLPTPSRSK